jgi:catechol 2,3-dioxygenase-like lactoylglutathione lyase family enzyme
MRATGTRTTDHNREGFPLGWVFIILCALLGLLSAHAHGQSVRRVESVGMTVSDMDRSLDLFTRVLGFEKISDREVWGSEFEHLTGVFGARARVVDLTLGDEKLEFTEYLTPQGRPVPVDSRSNDRWFQHVAIIVSDIDKAYALLRANKVRHASTAPQTLPSYITAAAGIKAFYFKDGDNHVLEILQFPDGKGKQKWHDLAQQPGKLFLGIDHTAIVVADTDESLKFYRDALGLNVAGESVNYGPEQEHLNNVFGVRLHITGLSAAEGGIGVEFLNYVAPTDGRPYPRDTRSNDLWHWETSFAVDDAAGFVAKLTRTNKLDLISSGVSNFADLPLGFRSGAVTRDPDGHAVRLEQR